LKYGPQEGIRNAQFPGQLVGRYPLVSPGGEKEQRLDRVVRVLLYELDRLPPQFLLAESGRDMDQMALVGEFIPVLMIWSQYHSVKRYLV
jgi:hypothetical protein